MIKNFDELNSKICDCSKSFDAKMVGENGKRAILLCGGTGCLSSNSAEIQEKFSELVKNIKWRTRFRLTKSAASVSVLRDLL